MKKTLRAIIIGLTVVAMAAALAACGGSAAPAESAPAEGAAPEAAPEAAPAGGKLIMATSADFPPYEFYEGNDFAGIDVDIMKAIAAELGMELEIQDMNFDSVITSVVQGKADVGASGLTVTEDRLKNVNFTTPYTTATQVIIVKEGSDIKTPDDLAGKKVAVQTGTTGDIYASDIEGAEVQQFTKGLDAILPLINGQVDAIMIDIEPAKAFVAENEGIMVLDDPFTEEEYAFALNKDNPDLLAKVNGALEKLIADGTVAEITAKYIK